MSSCPLLTELAAATWLPRQQPYLIGVSGGVDSMALLHLLVQAGYELLTVCHLNHGLRAAEADLDAAVVERTAAAYGLPLHIEKQAVRTLAGDWQCSIETAGRRARHHMFARVAAQLDCPRVLLAHHADDQLETILINLFRGSASLGRCGMQARQALRVNKAGFPQDLTLLRPLLRVLKQDLRDYAARHRLEFCEDPSNQTGDFLRNRVRNELIPLLHDAFQRDPALALLRLAEMSGEDEQWLTDLTLAELQQHQTGDPGSPASPPETPATLDATRLIRCPHALRRRVIHLWLQQHQVPGLDAETVQRVLTLITPDPASGSPARVNLPGNRKAGRTGGRLWVQ